jgi:hypothetical protein
VYLLYGLVLESELELPEAITARPGARPQAWVRLGDVAPEGLAGAEQLGPFAWSNAGALWLSVPGVARFLVSGGREIVVDPQPGVDEDTVRLFLLASPLAALLYQRGTFALHGNAIRLGDGCLVCVGASGAGKSTLAAEFMRRGHAILADDIVPLDGDCVLPGTPRLKLLPDAAKRLEISTDGLRPIRPSLTKLNFELGTAFSNEPAPLRWVYVIGRRGRQLEIRTLRGLECLAPLRAHTYRYRFVKGMDLLPEHLKMCGRVAAAARVSVLTLPTAPISPGAVVDSLLTDVNEHG